MEEKTARAKLRAWFRDQIEERPEFEAPELAHEGVAWARQDQDYLDALLKELLWPMAYNEVLLAIRSTRTEGPEPDPDIDPEEDDGEDPAPAPLHKFKYDSFRERTGGRHMKLMDAVREELIAMAASRRKMAAPHLELADLYLELARRLKPGQKVRDRFDASAIERIRLDIERRREARERKRRPPADGSAEQVS